MLQALMPLEDLDGIVAARELAARNVFDADDPLALFQRFNRFLLRDHERAVQIAEDEIARIDQHFVAEFAGDARRRLVIHHHPMSEGFDRIAPAAEDGETHRDQKAAVARRVVNQRADRAVRFGRGCAQLAVQGHTSSLHSHLANIVVMTGRSLKFDPKTETITGDAEAGKLLGRQYRKHRETPKEAKSL